MSNRAPIITLCELFISTTLTLTLGPAGCDEGDLDDLDLVDEDVDEIDPDREVVVPPSGDDELDEDADELTTHDAVGQYATADDETIAQAFRPRINFANSHHCWPLTFKEIATNASASERDALKDRCNSSFDGDFVVFASVKRPTADDSPHWTYWEDESFRVTYGVAFGWQENHLDSTQEWILDLFADGDMGSHGEDAQYVVVDVVDSKLESVWADLHKGSYSRTKQQLTQYANNHVQTWAGKWYNSLKLVEDTTTACGYFNDLPYELQTLCFNECAYGSTCGIGDPVTNFGDPVGNGESSYGKLVMVEDVCGTAGMSYTSPDDITYSGTQLDALKAFIGCEGAAGQWGNTFMEKEQYLDPYALPGCDSGDTQGGDICNASGFGMGTWRTWAGTHRSIRPKTVGNADVDYQAGTPFSDLTTGSAPVSISIRGGSRIDRVSVTYANGVTKSHGGMGGTEATIDDLDTDPVVDVYMCEGSDGNKERAGHITLTTAAGRQLSRGTGSSNCVSISPAGKKLYGFYGRSGSELDLLGTYWGNL